MREERVDDPRRVVRAVAKLPVHRQTTLRKDAQRAIASHGVVDAEVIFYEGFAYRAPAKLVLDAINGWRKERGWVQARQDL